MTHEKIATLKKNLAEAQSIAKEIVTDEVQGKSQFDASLPSVIDHSAELFANHEKWISANFLPPPATEAAKKPAASAKA